jgi:hypothetical protein
MATNPAESGPGPAPAKAPADVAAHTSELLRRYLTGEPLTPQEFGQVGVHYRAIGQSVPKDQRKQAVEAKRLGTAGAAQRLLDANPPPVPVVPGPAPEGGAASGDPRADAQLLADTARTLLRTVDGWVCGKVERTARKLGADRPTTSELVDSAKLEPTTCNLIADQVPIVAAKYGVGASYAPEIALLAGLTLYGGQVKAVLGKLSELEAKAAARERAQQEAQSQTGAPPA